MTNNTFIFNRTHTVATFNNSKLATYECFMQDPNGSMTRLKGVTVIQDGDLEMRKRDMYDWLKRKHKDKIGEGLFDSSRIHITPNQTRYRIE